MDRRNFLKSATVAAAGSVSPAGALASQFSTTTRLPESPNMIYRELGRTGERVSAIAWAATTSASSKTRTKASA
jgi:hypothetical protein